MKARSISLGLAVLTAAAVAACSGGGSGGTTPALSGGAPNQSVPQTSGFTATLTFNRNAGATHQLAHALRVGTAGSRKPQYVSYDTNGLQLTIVSGTASQTLYYDLSTNSSLCTYTGTTQTETCSLPVPSLGGTETLTAIEVNQAPNNLSKGTGLGTAFPSNSLVLARGATTATLTPGGVTTVNLALNPVIGSWYDCGYNAPGGTFAEDYSATPNRYVVTGNATLTATVFPAYADATGDTIFPVSQNGNGTYAGQPFTDVNGTLTGGTAVSNSSHVAIYPFSFSVAPSPSPPSPSAFVQSATFADSSYEIAGNYYSMAVFLSYDGKATTSSTLTFSNNLTAAPPAFTGSPNPQYTSAPSTYAASQNYLIAPVLASPAAFTVTHGTTATITGTDPGAGQNMRATSSGCTSGQTTLATVTSSAPLVSGSEAFTVTAGSTTGTCSFNLYDGYTGVASNVVTVTIN